MTVRGVNVIGALAGSLVLAAAASAAAQSRLAPIGDVRAPAVFGQIGHFQGGSDEGTIGSALSYSGAFMLPVSRRLGIDVDLQTSRVASIRGTDNFYTTRRTLIVPSLLYRFGREAVYGFVGGGIGAEFDDNTTRRDDGRPEGRPVGTPLPAGWREIRTGVFEIDRSDVSRITSFRGGVAAFPTRGFGVRGDVYMAGWNVGAKIGVGYRF